MGDCLVTSRLVGNDTLEGPAYLTVGRRLWGDVDCGDVVGALDSGSGVYPRQVEQLLPGSFHGGQGCAEPRTLTGPAITACKQ